MLVMQSSSKHAWVLKTILHAHRTIWKRAPGPSWWQLGRSWLLRRGSQHCCPTTCVGLLKRSLVLGIGQGRCGSAQSLSFVLVCESVHVFNALTAQQPNCPAALLKPVLLRPSEPLGCTSLAACTACSAEDKLSVACCNLFVCKAASCYPHYLCFLTALLHRWGGRWLVTQ